jgi:hypothetical protein
MMGNYHVRFLGEETSAPSSLKWGLGGAKAPGFNDRKWVHID